MKIRDSLGRWVARADDVHAAAIRRWYGASPFTRRWRIVPYRGFGTPHELYVSGRVLRHVHHHAADAAHSAWRNFADFWKHLESDELPGATVRVSCQSATTETISDDEGHFSAVLKLHTPVSPGWHELRLELVEPQPRNGAPVVAESEVVVPPETARYGVISDLDDTVVWSDVRRKLRMITMIVRSNAHTRKPFKGVAALYHALHAGMSGDERNPLFYVSNSPWNLYAPLVEFLDVQGLPRGPLMLRDFGDHLLFGSGSG
jgi:phosphatidate phosphatase APP1